MNPVNATVLPAGKINLQHVATGWPLRHATCCTQQCCDMLHWTVAIVWLGSCEWNGTRLYLQCLPPLLCCFGPGIICTCRLRLLLVLNLSLRVFFASFLCFPPSSNINTPIQINASVQTSCVPKHPHIWPEVQIHGIDWLLGAGTQFPRPLKHYSLMSCFVNESLLLCFSGCSKARHCFLRWRPAQEVLLLHCGFSKVWSSSNHGHLIRGEGHTFEVKLIFSWALFVSLKSVLIDLMDDKFCREIETDFIYWPSIVLKVTEGSERWLLPQASFPAKHRTQSSLLSETPISPPLQT